MTPAFTVGSLLGEPRMFQRVLWVLHNSIPLLSSSHPVGEMRNQYETEIQGAECAAGGHMGPEHNGRAHSPAWGSRKTSGRGDSFLESWSLIGIM